MQIQLETLYTDELLQNYQHPVLTPPNQRWKLEEEERTKDKRRGKGMQEERKREWNGRGREIRQGREGTERGGRGRKGGKVKGRGVKGRVENEIRDHVVMKKR